MAAPGTPASGCDGRLHNTAFGASPDLRTCWSIPNPPARHVDVATTVANGKGARDEGIDTNTLLGPRTCRSASATTRR